MKAHKGARSDLSDFAKKTLSTLGSGSMRDAVALPKGEELNEWLAVNTVDFFNEISMLYGTISEYCTNSTCPVMSAGDKVQYLWADGVKVKKPIKVTAPEYVDLLMTWVESQLNDEEIFPIKFDGSYPKKFHSICSVIYKRFFRIYAHIYHSHFKRIQRLGADAHLNTCNEQHTNPHTSIRQTKEAYMTHIGQSNHPQRIISVYSLSLSYSFLTLYVN